MEAAVQEMKEIWRRISSLVPESRTSRMILVGTAAGLITYYMCRKKYNLPPSPPGLPIVGNLFYLDDTPMYKKLIEWEKKYGPVIALSMGPFSFVVLNNLDVIQEAFNTKGADFAGRPHMFSTDVLTEGGKDIAFAEYGPTWQLHRKLALKALKFYMKGDVYQSTVNEVLGSVMEEMRSKMDSLDIRHYIKLTVFNIVCKICFNENVSSDDDEFLGFMNALELFWTEFSNGTLEDFFPILKICPTPFGRKYKRTVATMLGFIYKRVDQHRSTYTAGSERDFTDAMLMAQNEAEADENPEVLAHFTNTHLAQTVADIFIAGIDTSYQTLLWAVLYLAAFPEVQSKIQKELDDVMGARTIAVLADREKLPYTEAFLYETMRHATTIPLGMMRGTTCDTTVHGYDLPKDTTVFINVYAVHNDPKHWDNPQEFRPERFLNASGKGIQKFEAWLPFSVGKRACLAEALAKPNLHLILATLARNFNMQMPEGEKADLTPVGGSSFLGACKPYTLVLKDRLV